MMKKLFILACVCLLITSCNSNSKNTNDSAISTETTDMHNAENSLDYDGTYTGTFPAADCPGINMTLTIKKDKTFELILKSATKLFSVLLASKRPLITENVPYI